MNGTGVVVIAYNSADVIGVCLDACLRIRGAQIVVVDNASEDGTAEVVRARHGVRLIANQMNRGFAAAANQGIGELDTSAVLILNPDAVPLEDIDALRRAALEPGVGAAGGRLLDAGGVTQHGFNVRAFPTAATLAFEVLGLNRLFPCNPVNRRYRVRVASEVNIEVDQPAGAFLMVNRAAWQRIGGFDERFFPIWFEDVDFCRRLKDSGYRILYVPAASAEHIGAHSAAKLPWSRRQLFWYGSLLRYTTKHLRPWPRCVVSLAVVLGSLARMVHGIASRASLEPVFIYSKVIWLACFCCVGWTPRRVIT